MPPRGVLSTRFLAIELFASKLSNFWTTSSPSDSNCCRSSHVDRASSSGLLWKRFLKTVRGLKQHFPSSVVRERHCLAQLEVFLAWNLLPLYVAVYDFVALLKSYSYLRKVLLRCETWLRCPSTATSPTNLFEDWSRCFKAWSNRHRHSNDFDVKSLRVDSTLSSYLDKHFQSYSEHDRKNFACFKALQTLANSRCLATGWLQHC